MPGESPLSMMRQPARRSREPSAGNARRRRWPILAPVAVVVVAALAWALLWYYAAYVADRTLAGWVEREAAAGRVYSCGAQSIGGFPFSIDARCTDAAAKITNLQLPYALKAKAISFAANVWRPTLLAGDISGPVTLAETGRPPSWTADWAHARLSVRGVPPDPDALSVEFVQAHIDRAGAGAVLNIKGADLQSRLLAGSPRHNPVIGTTLHVVGMAASALHPLLAQPLDIELDAVLHGLKDLSPKPWAQRFREMQAGNGSFEIKSLHVVQNDVVVVGSGTLSLNANGRLDGVMRVTIAGIEHLVPLLGIDRLLGDGLDKLAGSPGATAQGISAIDRLVPGLSGALRESASASLGANLKKMGEPSSIGNQPAVVLPLRFADGAVYLGMLRVGEVPALF